MTNTYTLESGKVISEGQTITADELTVAELIELKTLKSGGFISLSDNDSDYSYEMDAISQYVFPLTIITLPAPEPSAVLRVQAIMEGMRNGKAYKFSKEGSGEKYIEEMVVIQAIADGWTVTEVV